MVWSVRNISLHSKGASMQLAELTVKRCPPHPSPCSVFVIVYFRDLNLFHPGFLLHQLESLFFFSPTMTGMKIAKTYRAAGSGSIFSSVSPYAMVTENNTDLDQQSPCQSHRLASSKINTRTRWNLPELLIFLLFFFFFFLSLFNFHYYYGYSITNIKCLSHSYQQS